MWAIPNNLLWPPLGFWWSPIGRLALIAGRQELLVLFRAGRSDVTIMILRRPPKSAANLVLHKRVALVFDEIVVRYSGPPAFIEVFGLIRLEG